MRAWPRLEAGVARAYGLIVVLASVGLTWIFALRSGQDANWDQLNYHIAVPFLLLQGGFWESVVPSGIQSYLNPAMPVLNYLAIAHLRPVLATLAIATPQATCFVAAGLICRQVARRAMGEMAWSGPALGGFALCLMSPMALSEAGTTYVDLVTAAPVLFAYGLLHRRSESRWLAIGAGLLIGVSAGLKLTNAIFVLGVPALVWLGGGSWRGRLVRLALVAVGSLVGLAASAGWWSAQVWQHFGNPVFPLANALFRSPDFPAVSINDTRFLPHSVWDALRWPIYWVTGGSPTPGLLSPGAEVDPRDARFLFAVLGVMALAVAALLRPTVLKRPQIGLIAAWGCVYVVWLAGFGIHRYMIGLEILTGAVLLALVMMLPRRARGGTLAVLCVVFYAVLHVPRWARVPFGDHWHAIETRPIPLPGPAVAFLADAPTGYVVASLPEGTRIVTLASDFDLSAGMGTRLTRQVRALLDAGRRPYLLSLNPTAADRSIVLASYGLRIGPSCRPETIGGATFTLCPLVPTTP